MYPIVLETQQLDVSVYGIAGSCKPSLPRQPYERELQNLAVKVLPEVKRRWPGRDDDHQRQEMLKDNYNYPGMTINCPLWTFLVVI